MEVLFEAIDNRYRPWGYATELTNGNVVGAYGNGNFTEYGKEKESTLFGMIHPSFGYKKTATGVEKIKYPRLDDSLIRLNMLGGKLVHNQSFCFTDHGILSFITGSLAELPRGAKKYEAEVNDETIFIIEKKRYYFDGVSFIEK